MNKTLRKIYLSVSLLLVSIMLFVSAAVAWFTGEGIIKKIVFNSGKLESEIFIFEYGNTAQDGVPDVNFGDYDYGDKTEVGDVVSTNTAKTYENPFKAVIGADTYEYVCYQITEISIEKFAPNDTYIFLIAVSNFSNASFEGTITIDFHTPTFGEDEEEEWIFNEMFTVKREYLSGGELIESEKILSLDERYVDDDGNTQNFVRLEDDSQKIGQDATGYINLYITFNASGNATPEELANKNSEIPMITISLIQ